MKLYIVLIPHDISNTVAIPLQNILAVVIVLLVFYMIGKELLNEKRKRM